MNLDYSCISAIILSTAYLAEEYNEKNTFIFINPNAKSAIEIQDFGNLIYWDISNHDNQIMYVPKNKLY